MARKYFTKGGFEGLTGSSKAICVAVFAVVGLITWFSSGFGSLLRAVLTIGIPFLAAWITQIFLPRDRYYRDEYFCAACGQFIGYAPGRCDRCGCNRYTTEDKGAQF